MICYKTVQYIDVGHGLSLSVGYSPSTRVIKYQSVQPCCSLESITPHIRNFWCVFCSFTERPNRCDIKKEHYARNVILCIFEPPTKPSHIIIIIIRPTSTKPVGVDIESKQCSNGFSFGCQCFFGMRPYIIIIVVVIIIIINTPVFSLQ